MCIDGKTFPTCIFIIRLVVNVVLFDSVCVSECARHKWQHWSLCILVVFLALCGPARTEYYLQHVMFFHSIMMAELVS